MGSCGIDDFLCDVIIDPPDEPGCEGVAICCSFAQQGGVDDEDLIVEIQALDFHL